LKRELIHCDFIPENLLQVHDNIRSYFLQNLYNWTDVGINKLKEACNKVKQKFVGESSGFVFKLKDLSFLGNSLICEVNETNRKLFAETFYDLSDSKFDQLRKFCQFEELSFKDKAKLFLDDDEFNLIQPSSMCHLDRKGKLEVLRQITGGLNLWLDQIEEMCRFGYEFEKFV
jgi:hypothetical protein